MQDQSQKPKSRIKFNQDQNKLLNSNSEAQEELSYFNTSKQEIETIHKPEPPHTMSLKSIYSCTNFMTINSIIEARGYSAFQVRSILVYFLITGIEGFQITLFSSMIIPFSQYYDLHFFWLKLASAIIFLGLGVGSYSLGYLTDRFNRRNLLFSVLTLILCFHLLMALTTDIYMFILCRFAVGFCVGVELPLGLNILCETLPKSNRSLAINLGWTGYSFFQIMCLVVMLLIMPDYDPDNVPLVLCLTWIILVFSVGVIVYIFTDSPRKLILQFEDERAYEILKDIISPYVMTRQDFKMVKYNTLKENQETIRQARSFHQESADGTILNDSVLDSKQGKSMHTPLVNLVKGLDQSSFEEESKLSVLFNEKYRLSTVLILLLALLCACIFYGPLLIVSIVIKQIQEKYSLQDDAEFSTSGNVSVLTHNINIILLTVLSGPIAGLASEVGWIGRRYSMIIAYSVSVAGNLLLLLCPVYYELAQVLILFFGGAGYSVFCVYFSELYPTYVKDFASGLIFFTNRIGGFFSQFLFLLLLELGVFVPFWILLVLQLICILVIYALPFDTVGEENE